MQLAWLAVWTGNQCFQYHQQTVSKPEASLMMISSWQTCFPALWNSLLSPLWMRDVSVGLFVFLFWRWSWFTCTSVKSYIRYLSDGSGWLCFTSMKVSALLWSRWDNVSNLPCLLLLRFSCLAKRPGGFAELLSGCCPAAVSLSGVAFPPPTCFYWIMEPWVILKDTPWTQAPYFAPIIGPHCPQKLGCTSFSTMFF